MHYIETRLTQETRVAQPYNHSRMLQKEASRRALLKSALSAGGVITVLAAEKCTQRFLIE